MLAKYPLPEPWIEVYDAGLARHYYWNQDTDDVSQLCNFKSSTFVFRFVGYPLVTRPPLFQTQPLVLLVNWHPGTKETIGIEKISVLEVTEMTGLIFRFWLLLLNASLGFS